MDTGAIKDKNSLKLENRKTVLDVFRKNAIMTVAEASEATGLSKPTVHRVAGFLQKKKLLMPTGKGFSGDEGGKKPVLLSFNAIYRHILCHQILSGGLLSAVSDLRGRLLAETSVAFPTNTPLRTILDHMKNACDSMSAGLRLREGDFAGVVVGTHGVTDSDKGTISNSPYYPVWGSNINFSRQVEKLFDNSPPVYIDNSNRYDAYAEMRVGQARGRKSFMTLDGELDGLGAGLVLNGELWRGGQYLAGEIGHMIVDHTGARQCPCGAWGCLEVMASMNSMIDNARKGFAKNKKSLLFARLSPAEVSHLDIFDCANAGDAFARGLVDDLARWLAIGLSSTMMVADPELIVLQGPYAKGGDYFLERLRHHIPELGLPRLRKKVDIVYSNFGRERGLVGAAHYVADIFFNDPSIYE